MAACRIAAVSCISTMNVDWPRAMLSDAPTRAKMRSTTASLALRAGHERTGLRQQGQQRDLPQVGGLAAHVRPGQDDDLRAVGVELHVVRHEGSGDVPLDDRVARVGGLELVAVVEERLGEVARRRRCRPAPASTSSAATARAVSSTRGASAATVRRKAFEQLQLARRDPLVGAEDLVLVFLQSAGVMNRSPPATVCLRM